MKEMNEIGRTKKEAGMDWAAEVLEVVHGAGTSASASVRASRCPIQRTYPPFLHPATNKSGERRAKSYLGAWGGKYFGECHFLNQLAPPKSNSKSL